MHPTFTCNFKSNVLKGKAFKEELYAAARSTTQERFDHHMNVIKGMDKDAFNYLERLSPNCWLRHAFDTECKSDMISNNIAESFNSWIKDARDKPLLTMLELIRRKLMNTFHSKREGAKLATNDICPNMQKKKKKRNWIGRKISKDTTDVNGEMGLYLRLTIATM